MPRKKNLPAKVSQEGKNLGGAPSKLTEENVKTIVQLLSMGSYVDIAACFAGLNPRTVQFWIARGKAEPGSIYADFLYKVREALAKSETRDLAIIDMVAQGRPAKYKERPMKDKDGNFLLKPNGEPYMELERDADGNPVLLQSEMKPNWQTSAWKLERRSPQRWGRFDRIMIDDMTKVNEEIDVSKSTEKEKEEVKTPLAEREKKILAIMSKMKDLEDVEDL
jgi:transposase